MAIYFNYEWTVSKRGMNMALRFIEITEIRSYHSKIIYYECIITKFS